MTDFEIPLRQAIQISFALSLLKGCYYHFIQSIWRKVQSLGLQRAYTEEEEVRTCVCKMGVLALVPRLFVRVAFNGIEIPDVPHIPEFTEYFESTWLNGNFLFLILGTMVLIQTTISKGGTID